MIADDIPQLALLYKQFWGEDSCIEAMYNQFYKICGNSTHVLLSAIENGQLVGSVMGVICAELYGSCKPFMILENMIVDRKYRNKAIGKTLIAELEKIAINKGCTQIILVTETTRVDACNFYESVGYNPNTHRGFKKRLSDIGF
jgi:GNAT superfamily N-acetyltransferase